MKIFEKLEQILEVGWKSGTILVTIVVRTHWIVSSCWFGSVETKPKMWLEKPLGSWLRSKLGTTLGSTCRIELG